jgi:hypothetical protein
MNDSQPTTNVKPKAPRTRGAKGAVDAEPLPGTHLYPRRTPAGKPACPVYKGDGDLRAALDEGERTGQAGVTYGTETYALLSGKWYPLRLI